MKRTIIEELEKGFFICEKNTIFAFRELLGVYHEEEGPNKEGRSWDRGDVSIPKLLSIIH